MEFNINLNAEDLKRVMEDGTLAAMIQMCSFGGTEPTTGAQAAPVQETKKAITSTPQKKNIAPDAVTGTPGPQMPAPAEVPTAAPAYSRDQLALAAGSLMETNMQGLQDILKDLGVAALTELSEDKFDAFAAGIRALGAKI